MFYYSMLMHSGQTCLEHSVFLKVKCLLIWLSSEERIHIYKRMAVSSSVRGQEALATRLSTTSFLTATTLIYAIGAGITAAAGTRLALQLLLDKFIKLFSFR